tara:strand:- start:7 stop:447 length:441 start_codon:yes stop_codon:yes gene_type:complete
MKMKYLAMFGISANLKKIINVIDTNVAITVPTPVLTPTKFRINTNASSVVAGIINSDIENLAGSANFITLNAALIEKSVSNDNEATLACLLKLGKRFLIPLPIIAPCSNPIPRTIAKVIKKFCSAKSSILKSYQLDKKQLGLDVIG